YPQREFPSARLIEENRRRGKDQPEFELLDTGVLDEDRYFDVFVEYAKAGPEDILMRVTIHNRGPEEATIHVLPQLWFRNTWSWSNSEKPKLSVGEDGAIVAEHDKMGEYRLYTEHKDAERGTRSAEQEVSLLTSAATLLFCDNETNVRRHHHQNQ